MERVAIRPRASSKADLLEILARLSADEDGIRHTAWGAVDCLFIYTRNTKGPPAAPILPGFAPDGSALTPSKALAAFKQFCRTQLGQRGHFIFISHENPPLAPKAGRVFADFDPSDWGGDEYLMLKHGPLVTSTRLPCEAEGWVSGRLGCVEGFFRPAICNGCPSNARWGKGAKDQAQAR